MKRQEKETVMMDRPSACSRETKIKHHIFLHTYVSLSLWKRRSLGSLPASPTLEQVVVSLVLLIVSPAGAFSTTRIKVKALRNYMVLEVPSVYTSINRLRTTKWGRITLNGVRYKLCCLILYISTIASIA